MNASDLNVLSHAQCDIGTDPRSPHGRPEFIDLHLTYLHQGNQHSVPVLTLSPDQARTLAMALLAAADKAVVPSGRTGPTMN